MPSGKNKDGKYNAVKHQLAIQAHLFLRHRAEATIIGTITNPMLKITLKVRRRRNDKSNPSLLSQNKNIPKSSSR
jgi:hypothetical protein